MPWLRNNIWLVGEEDRTRHTTLEDELSQFDYIDEHAATDCSGSDINSDEQEWASCSNDNLELPSRQGIMLPNFINLKTINFITS